MDSDSEELRVAEERSPMSNEERGHAGDGHSLPRRVVRLNVSQLRRVIEAFGTTPEVVGMSVDAVVCNGYQVPNAHACISDEDLAKLIDGEPI